MSLIQHALEFGFCDGASPMGQRGIVAVALGGAAAFLISQR
jgi:hypothetical protein